MSKLTRKAIEKAMADAANCMYIVKAKGEDWKVEVRGMAIDAFIDSLDEQGIKVDETLTEAEIAQLVHHGTS